MKNELSKAIIKRSKLKNRCTKWASREKFWHLRSRGVSLRILTKTLKSTTSNEIMGTKKQIWNTVRPFLTFKCFLNNEDIALDIGDKTVTDCNEIARKFNEYFINIVQNTTGKGTIKLQDSNNDKSSV